MHQLSNALAPLSFYQQFIIYQLVPKNDGSGKADKQPVNPQTRRPHNPHDPAIWLDVQSAQAIATAWGYPYGLGFVLTDNDPFVFIDIDNCLMDNAQWSPLANSLLLACNGAAVEISQSGTGLHIIGAYTAVGAHRCKPADRQFKGLELYHAERFIALTDAGTIGNALHDLTPVLPGIIEAYFNPGSQSGGDQIAGWTNTAAPDYGGPDSDDELITMMLSRGGGAGQIFGTRASLAELWNADPVALGRAYPDTLGDQGRAYDASSADAALASHLAFWTGRNCERIERLMWRSSLPRDKWTQHKSYLSRTIIGAASKCDAVYSGKQSIPEQPELPPPPVGGGPLSVPFHASAETYALLGAREKRLLRFNSEWLTRETGGYYRPISDEIIRSEIRTACSWQINPTKVNTAQDELKSALIVDAHGVELPYWLTPVEGMADAHVLIVCENGILDPTTNRLYEHDDNLLTFNALPFKFNPTASAPARWLKFLSEVFPDDPEAVHELQKMIGYLLTLDTRLQKIFMIIGPKRSGKGTLARILRALIGSENICGPTFSGLARQFGMQSLIGKQAAIIPDGRLGRSVDRTVIAERLLSISGEDSLNIERKQIGDWYGKLSTRVVVLSNDVPILGDPSGALASRYIMFNTPDSFYGRENPNLTDELIEELPGIFNWALQGLRNLRAEKTIRTPASAEHLSHEMDRLGAPIKSFVEDYCNLEPAAVISKEDLWKAYKKWHHDKGQQGQPRSLEIFGRDFKSAFSRQVKEYRPVGVDGRRPYYWRGIALNGETGETLAETILGRGQT